ncbi:MAG: hypothetical protein WBM13_05740 [Bacteroidia bacterium]
MKLQEARLLIAAQLKKHDQVTAQELNYETKIPFVQIYGILKFLNQEGAVEIETKDNIKLYKVADSSKMHLLINEVDATKTQEPSKELGQKPASLVKVSRYENKPTRDTSVFRFRKGDEPKGKGQTVLAIVKAYVADHSATLADIKEAFADEMVGKWGVTEMYKKAVENPLRYLTKDHQIIVTHDKKKICTTNQWTVDRFEVFCDAAQKIGYKITKVEKFE